MVFGRLLTGEQLLGIYFRLRQSITRSRPFVLIPLARTTLVVLQGVDKSTRELRPSGDFGCQGAQGLQQHGWRYLQEAPDCENLEL